MEVAAVFDVFLVDVYGQRIAVVGIGRCAVVVIVVSGLIEHAQRLAFNRGNEHLSVIMDPNLGDIRFVGLNAERNVALNPIREWRPAVARAEPLIAAHELCPFLQFAEGAFVAFGTDAFAIPIIAGATVLTLEHAAWVLILAIIPIIARKALAIAIHTLRPVLTHVGAQQTRIIDATAEAHGQQDEDKK